MKLCYRLSLTLVCDLVLTSSMAIAWDTYPPPRTQPEISSREPIPIEANKKGLIFTNVHNYGSVIIQVELFDNYFGDFTKYHWVYTVSNLAYDPVPGTSNGFSRCRLSVLKTACPARRRAWTWIRPRLFSSKSSPISRFISKIVLSGSFGVFRFADQPTSAAPFCLFTLITDGVVRPFSSERSTSVTACSGSSSNVATTL